MYENVVIGTPLVHPSELLAFNMTDWEENEKKKTLFTNTRYLPTIMKEAGIVQSTREVRRNRPELCCTLNTLDYIELKWGKRFLFIMVGVDKEETDLFKLGPGMLYLNDKPFGTLNECETTLAIDPDDYPDYTPAINYRPEPFECECESTIDIPTLQILTGNVPTDSSRTFDLTYSGTCFEQIRRHKKKRINKKWAKRYGYREVPCTYCMRDSTIENLNDGEVMITSGYVEVVKGE